MHCNGSWRRTNNIRRVFPRNETQARHECRLLSVVVWWNLVVCAHGRCWEQCGLLSSTHTQLHTPAAAFYSILANRFYTNMSVVVHNTEGWVLDACSLINQGYSRCVRFKDHKQTNVRGSFKKQCFNVLKSYCSVNKSAVSVGGNASVLQKTDKPSKVKDW